MAQNTDVISVGITADTSGLASGFQQAASIVNSGAGQITSAASSAADAIYNLAGALGLSFSVDKLVEVAHAALDSAEQVNNLSQSLGVSTKNLQTMSYAAGLVGGNLDTVSTSLAHAERTANAAASGNVQAAAAFNALGISASQLAGLLKNPDQLMQVLAQHVSQFGDGVGKTSAVVEIFGRNAAQIIPFLNEMGGNFDELTKESEALGVTLSGQTQAALLQANEGLDKSALAAKGLGNEFAAALVPAINAANSAFQEFAASGNAASFFAQLGDFLKTAIDWFQQFATTVQHVTVNVAEYWDEMVVKMTASLADKTAGWANAIGGALSVLSGGALGGFVAGVDKAASASDGLTKKIQGLRDAAAGANADIDKNQANYQAAAASADALGKAVGNYYEVLANGNKSEAAHDAALQAIAAASDALIAKGNDYNTVINAEVAAVAKVDTAYQRATSTQVNYNAAAKDTADALAKTQDQAAKFLVSLNGFGADKYTKVWTDYNAKITEADLLYAKLLKDGDSLADAQKFLADATALATAGFDAQVQAMRNANDVDAIFSKDIADATADLSEKIRLLGEDQQSAEADALANQLINKALGDMKDFMGPLTQEQQDQIDTLKNLARSYVETSDAVKASKQVLQDWQNIATQGFDSLGNTIAQFLTGGIKSWHDFGAALVDDTKQFIAQVIQEFLKLTIFNGIINSLFGLTGSAALPTIGSAIASAAGAAGGYSGSFNMGGPSGTFSSSNMMSAGQSLFTGFKIGFDKLWTGGVGNSFLGTVNYGDFGNTFTPSGFTYGAAAAGGIYAGVNEFQNAGGGAAGIAGGLAYGYGTYTAGVAGAAALSGGLSAGLSAIGPIGWIALGAMIIDQLSGGKLFGTAGKFNFGQLGATISAAGTVAVTAGYDTKGQKPLFGGSTHDWTSVTPSPDAVNAWNQFMTQLIAGNKAFAESLGGKAGDIAAAQFLQNFDKHGNVIGSTTTIAGHTYSGETAQQFEERETAETMINTLSQFDSALSASIDQYRANADQLYALTQQLAAAQVYINNGGKFLALGSDQSLSALLKLAAGMQQMGETIDQTVARIEQAQAQYNQFVGQFKPQATYTDAFQASLAAIQQQMEQNIAQANALAKAAGAEGASEEDLANIHSYAAQQMAAAIAQLKSASATLAQQLGYAPSTDLSSINSEISALEAQKQAYASSIGGASNALQQAAQRAQQAMNLLLGDLSPYNDQQKLQMALAGQRAGTVTPEQVLTIARQLYSTGADYNAIFAQVMAVGDRTGQHQGAFGGGTSWTASDANHLASLEAQRDQIEQAQRHTDALQLAQNIADTVSATGETIDQALADAGIKDITPFLKDLGIANKDDFDKFVTGLEKQTDSAGDNTAVIAGKIDTTNTLLQALIVQLGGTPPPAAAGTAPGSTGSPPGGHGGHSAPPPPRSQRSTAPPPASRVR